jgi:trehalose 6-phosphate synthase/phosphatase
MKEGLDALKKSTEPSVTEKVPSENPEYSLPAPEGLTWNREIVVSNRLPVTVKYDADGAPIIASSSGGLVTALSPLLREGRVGKWIGWSGIGEQVAASGQFDDASDLEEALRTKPNGSYDMSAVRLTPEEVKGFYEGISNDVLVPLFLGRIGKVNFPLAHTDWSIYRNVQRRFAEKICSDLRSGDIIWVHDYQLIGVGTELRNMQVKQPTGFFLHTPFPEKEKLILLPESKEILQDILAYDLVGFQTNTFKTNFLDAVRAFMPEITFQETGGPITLVHISDRMVRVGHFPISIDPQEFEAQLHAPQTQRNIARLEKVLHENGDVQMIFNAGRLDYTKGFYEELLAFDRLLTEHPELIGKVILCQLVIPSRESIASYGNYKTQITELSSKINVKYKSQILVDFEEQDINKLASPDIYPGRPVRQVHGHQGRFRFIAHLGVMDIQDFPSRADGMGLIPKEGAVVGKETMTQLIGKDTGVAEELGDHALLIEPRNTKAFADALYKAYTMVETERIARKTALKGLITENDVRAWWSMHQEPAFQEIWNEKVASQTSTL